MYELRRTKTRYLLAEVVLIIPFNVSLCLLLTKFTFHFYLDLLDMAESLFTGRQRIPEVFR